MYKVKHLSYQFIKGQLILEGHLGVFKSTFRTTMLEEKDINSFLFHCRFTAAGEQEICHHLSLNV